MNAERLRTRQEEIKSLAGEGYTVKELNDGYCYRINGLYDLYPVNNKWHHLPSGRRGAVQNLKTFLKDSLPASEVPTAKLHLPEIPHTLTPAIAPSALENPDILNGKICWYCGNPTKLVSSTSVYAKDYGLIYLCEPCEAWVGMHENTTIGK